jgi:hypothetical protein
MQQGLTYSAPVLRLRGVSLSRPQHLEDPSGMSASPLTPVKEWVVVVLLLATAIVWYGSLTGFCLAVCGGWGHVVSCSAQWGVWAQAVCR